MPGSQRVRWTQGAATILRRAWGRPLWFHAASLAVLLTAAAPLLRLSDAFTIDEGAYAVQVRDLDQGRWEFDYRAEAADPEGRWLPLYNPERGARHWYAYVKQPAYPAALWAVTRVAGDVVGLHLLAMLGALGVAVATWLLAGEIDPGASRGAFWLAASGPVAVNAYVVWAHAPSAAVAGFAMLAGVRLRNRFRPLWAVVLLLCVGVGVLLRAEGLLFAVALGLGLLVVGFKALPRALRVGVPACCALGAAGTLLLESRWRSAIVGSAYRVQGLRGDDASPVVAGGGSAAWRRWAGGRLQGAWNSLFQGSMGDPLGAVLVAAALVVLVFVAWVVHRRREGWRREAGVALGAATALYALRMVLALKQPMTGMFAAWPAAMVGLVLLPRQGLRVARPLVVVVGLFALAVLATQYRIGGGREWGGRFLFPVLAPVAVLACMGLRHLLRSLDGERTWVAGLVGALVLVPTFTGLSLLRTDRGQAAAIIQEVTSDKPSLVMTYVTGLPPFAWKRYPEVAWMVVQPEEFEEATTRLQEAGVASVTILGPDTLSPVDLAAYPVVEDVTGAEARRRGWRTFRLSATSR